MSFIQKIIIVLTLITLISLGGLLYYNHDRVYYNDDSEQGNWAGNIFNGSLFCEKDGIIYFSNPNDNYNLYAATPGMTNYKLLYPDSVAGINVDGNYIYFLKVNLSENSLAGETLTFNNSGLYRIKQNGSDLKVLSNSPAGIPILQGNFLYYQSYDVEENLFVVRHKIDKTKERKLLANSSVPYAIINGRLLYTGTSSNQTPALMSINLSSYTKKIELSGHIRHPFIVGEYLYYIDKDDKKALKRISLNGGSSETLVSTSCSTYNITLDGSFLYFQTDRKKNNYLGRLNLGTMDIETIREGTHQYINVTDRHVFFQDMEDSLFYQQSSLGIPDAVLFDPPTANVPQE